MSTVIWCEIEAAGDGPSPDDLPALLKHVDSIDAILAKAGEQPLSAVLDNSDLEFNLSEDDLGEEWLAANAKWLAPAPVRRLMSRLRDLLDEKNAQLAKPELAELRTEIDYVIGQCDEAERKGARVRLVVVM